MYIQIHTGSYHLISELRFIILHLLKKKRVFLFCFKYISMQPVQNSISNIYRGSNYTRLLCVTTFQRLYNLKTVKKLLDFCMKVFSKESTFFFPFLITLHIFTRHPHHITYKLKSAKLNLKKLHSSLSPLSLFFPLLC